MGDRGQFERAGPWARIELPDGQELNILVTARTRTPDGKWWFECEAVLYGRTAYPNGQTHPEAAAIAFSAPADAVQPIDGQDYKGSRPSSWCSRSTGGCVGGVG